MSQKITLFSSMLIIVLAGLSLLPASTSSAHILALAIIALSILTLVMALKEKASQAAKPAPTEAAENPAAESAHPQLNAVPEQSGEVQVAQLLSLLQEKGRFLDFVMDDIKSYPDAQIAAAARFVHQGCQTVIQNNFKVEPVATVAENAAITLEADYSRNDYRLSGKIDTEPPYSGVLKHKGWKTTAINLPKVMGSKAEARGTHLLAAAEVEVR